MASNSQSSSLDELDKDDKEFKVVLIGDSGIGKTAVMRMLAENIFNEDGITTIGISTAVKTVTRNGKTARFIIWDTAGQEKFLSLAPLYCRNSDAVLVCYDITNLKSFENIDKWLELTSIPEEALIVLVGCKLDMKEHRVVSTVKGLEKAGTLRPGGVWFFETSAKTNTNIDDLFEYLVAQLMSVGDASSHGEVVRVELEGLSRISKRKAKCCSK